MIDESSNLRPLKDKHIYIVEDDSRNRVVYRVIMMRQGAHTTFDNLGTNIQPVLEAGQAIDLFILDLMLGNFNSGSEVFKLIKQYERYADVPVVAVSASEPADAIPRVQGLGFDGFIPKPIDDEQFPFTLQRILKGEKLFLTGMQG